LYESVVSTPEEWTEQAFVDWATDAVSGPIEKGESKALRQVLRAAEKLRRFWSGPAAPRATEDWRSRVDLALGPRAWRPTLDLAMAGLETSPDPELFVEVQRRFRLVHGDVWLDGAGYETWLSQQGVT
jgi:hypothetical protein